MRKKICNIKSLVLIFLLFSLVVCIPSHATVYFSFDAESSAVGSTLPQATNGVYFEFSTAGSPGTVRNSPLVAKQGSKYFGWNIAANQHDAQSDVRDRSRMPFNVVLGNTYYLAYFFNYTEINGIEVYRTNINEQECFDKGVELLGSGLRWNAATGSRWQEMRLSPHEWSIFLGNSTYHLNPQLEQYDYFLNNRNNYNLNNWPKIQAGRWHSVVMAIKMAQDNTGSVKLYLNGVLIAEYINIKTVATGATPTIDHITMNGTVCQPNYNTSAHVKNYDAMILTDNLQDILNGGYLSGGSIPAGTSPSPPLGLRVVSGQ